MKPTKKRFGAVQLGARLGPWKGALGYAAFTLAAFLIALLYGLPHDLIAQRILQEVTAQAPVRISFSEVGFAFPNGYRFEDVRISSEDQPLHTVQIPELSVSAPLSSLLLGSVDSANFSAELYGGELAGSVAAREGKVAARIEAEDLQIAPIARQFLTPPGAVGGRASFTADFEGDGRSMRSAKGNLRLSARDVSLDKITAQGILLPDLAFTTVVLDADLAGTRAKVNQFEAIGNEASLKSEGTLLIREPVGRTVLDLKLGIDVSDQARPGLKTAISLLPRNKSKGKNQWNLRGVLASPSLR